MWQKLDSLDYKSKEEINLAQEIALQKHLQYLNTHSTFYKAIFKSHKIDISTIKTIADLALIPTTTKGDFEIDNEAFQCVPNVKVVELVTTSGTSGRSITIALTKNDLDRLTYNEKRSLELAGIRKEDTIQITTTLDKLFMAGMAYYMGSVAIGATVIRSGIGNPNAQWDNILRFKPTATIAVPSFLYKLANYGLRKDINPNNSSLKKAICIGEPIRNADFSPNKMNQKISDNWDLDLYSTYASTEMMTAFTECESQKGGHQLPELIIVEILDDNGLPVKEGALGEVTVTPLGVEGMPVLRYKTGDLARAYYGKCDCGKNTTRLGPVEGRKNQMIKFKGTTVFPQSIEDVLHAFDEVEHHVIELITSSLDTDLVRVYIPDTVSDALLSTIKRHFAESIRVTPDIKRIEKKILMGMLFPEGTRKPKKFVDNRNVLDLN
jgi:phenylacetate-CoA ligase